MNMVKPGRSQNKREGHKCEKETFRKNGKNIYTGEYEKVGRVINNQMHYTYEVIKEQI